MHLNIAVWTWVNCVPSLGLHLSTYKTMISHIPKAVTCCKSNNKGRILAQHFRKASISISDLWCQQYIMMLEEMKNPRVSRRKEILKIRAEINAKETKETIAKINNTAVLCVGRWVWRRKKGRGVPGPVLESCTFLRICPFLPRCPFYWHIIVDSSLLWSFVFLCCLLWSLHFHF